MTTFGDYAFEFCDNLTSFTIPNNVTSVGANPFKECYALQSIIVAPDHPTLAVIDEALICTPEQRLVSFPCASPAKSFTVPDGIRTIGNTALSFCDNLLSVTISNSVTTIEDLAFWYSRGLTDITIPGSVTSVGKRAFAECDGLKSVTIPAGVTFIDEDAFEWTPATLTVEPGSYAEQYAAAYGLAYVYAEGE